MDCFKDFPGISEKTACWKKGRPLTALCPVAVFASVTAKLMWLKLAPASEMVEGRRSVVVGVRKVCVN